MRQHVQQATLEPCGVTDAAGLAAALNDIELVIAAGAAGVQLLDEASRRACDSLRVAIDLNAVPPAGIKGIGAMDSAAQQDGVFCYGAIGVGATKMRIHKAALRRLFTSNEHVLDAETIYELGHELEFGP